jgi:hypothetical protein
MDTMRRLTFALTRRRSRCHRRRSGASRGRAACRVSYNDRLCHHPAINPNRPCSARCQHRTTRSRRRRSSSTWSLASFSPRPVASRRRLRARMCSPWSSALRTSGGTVDSGSYPTPAFRRSASSLPSTRESRSNRVASDDRRCSRMANPTPPSAPSAASPRISVLRDEETANLGIR